mmetsp:Transcript_119775/g.310642  ORF Transcript_119775/g.310642 Transcript_119775/m.310642 type:complete len:195 (-) Transcript_119775:92-676(-)
MTSASDVRASSIQFATGPPRPMSTTTGNYGGLFMIGGPQAEQSQPLVETRAPSRGSLQLSRSLGSLSGAGSMRVSATQLRSGTGFGASLSMRQTENKEMRKTLRATSVFAGTSTSEFRSDYEKNYPVYSRAQQKESMGTPDPALKADLMAVHYQLGGDSQATVPYSWYETDTLRCEKSHWDPKMHRSGSFKKKR